MTVMPGWIDAHVHITWIFGKDGRNAYRRDNARRCLPSCSSFAETNRPKATEVANIPDSSDHYLLLSKRKCGMVIPVGNPKSNSMTKRADVQQGTLALMVLKTLDVLGPLHGYGIARRIEQISGDLLAVNQGTLYPVLLKLEQEAAILSEWGASENNRRARFYRLTRSGRKLLETETRDWEQTAVIIARFFAVKAEDLT
jgi:PadR family transcriptional regulator PadR